MNWPSLRAGDGNRTRMTSLEGWSSTIELRPRLTLKASRLGLGHERSLCYDATPARYIWAASANGKYLYAEAGRAGAVDEFQVGSNGSLSPLGRVAGLGAGMEGIAADWPARPLYRSAFRLAVSVWFRPPWWALPVRGWWGA